jgi:hypothetical protein
LKFIDAKSLEKEITDVDENLPCNYTKKSNFILFEERPKFAAFGVVSVIYRLTKKKIKNKKAKNNVVLREEFCIHCNLSRKTTLHFFFLTSYNEKKISGFRNGRGRANAYPLDHKLRRPLCHLGRW